MSKIAIYPGTFDPITFGHIDVIKKSLKLFDKVVVGVSDESNKNYLFSSDEIIEIVNKALFKDLKLNKNAAILLVNSNFGCGSSREHAPQALMRWGIKAIIGESFAEIFYSNCVAIGVPCFTLAKKDIKSFQVRAEKGNLFFEIDIKNAIAREGSTKHNLEIKESSKNMFLSGEWDATSTLLNNIKLIESKLDNLPYINLNK